MHLHCQITSRMGLTSKNSQTGIMGSFLCSARMKEAVSLWHLASTSLLSLSWLTCRRQLLFLTALTETISPCTTSTTDCYRGRESWIGGEGQGGEGKVGEGWGGVRGAERERERAHTQRQNSNLKTLVLKDSSIRSSGTYLTANPC